MSWKLAVAAGVAVLLLAAIYVVVRKYRQTPAIDRQLRRQLRRLRLPYLHDIYLPDGMDGQIHIDYLAKAGDTLFVIDVIHCDGKLFAGERMDRWSQVKGMRTYRFDNPLSGNLMRTGSVRSLAPDLSVRGLVLFPDECEFPKGRPQGVIALTTMNETLSAAATGSKDAGADVWHEIEGLVARH